MSVPPLLSRNPFRGCGSPLRCASLRTSPALCRGGAISTTSRSMVPVKAEWRLRRGTRGANYPAPRHCRQSPFPLGAISTISLVNTASSPAAAAPTSWMRKRARVPSGRAPIVVDLKSSVNGRTSGL